MTDLVTWLRAQLDDDEHVALAAGGENWPDSAHEMWTNELVHARRHDPARVLAEVDAKRRILAFVVEVQYLRMGPPLGGNDARLYGDSILRLLALPYADRPGYCEDWKP